MAAAPAFDIVERADIALRRDATTMTSGRLYVMIRKPA